MYISRRVLYITASIYVIVGLLVVATVFFLYPGKTESHIETVMSFIAFLIAIPIASHGMHWALTNQAYKPLFFN